MVKRIIFAAIIGAFIAFVWGNISWVVMDWHLKTTHQFKNEAAVATVLRDNATQSGVYFLPQMPIDMKSKSAAEQKTLKDAMETRYKEGPRAFVGVTLGPGDLSMTKEIIQYFLSNLIFGFAIAILLACCSSRNYLSRVIYVGFIGLLMGSYSNIFAVTWFHYSWEFALLNALDGLIAWTLAGLVMAAIVKKSPITH